MGIQAVGDDEPDKVVDNVIVGGINPVACADGAGVAVCDGKKVAVNGVKREDGLPVEVDAGKGVMEAKYSVVGDGRGVAVVT